MTATLNLSVDQGTHFARTLRFYQDAARTEPTDLTSKTLKAQVRADWDKELLIEIDVDVTDSEAGEAELVVTAAMTANRIPGRYRWDLLVVPAVGDPTKYIEGSFTILGTITKTP